MTLICPTSKERQIMRGRVIIPADTPFARWLADRLASDGLTLRRLGEKSDLTHARLSQYIGGDIPPRKTVERIAAGLVPEGLNDEEASESYERILRDGLRAAGFTPEEEHELDIDLQLVVESWHGASETGKRAIKSAAELALEMSREGSIGGKRAE